jgi:hypothetical protein
MRFLAPLSLISLLSVVCADITGSSLYPPGLLPLINRANVLLSSGQYNDAAKAYSEAIGSFTLLFSSDMGRDVGPVSVSASEIPFVLSISLEETRFSSKTHSILTLSPPFHVQLSVGNLFSPHSFCRTLTIRLPPIL